MAPRRAAKIDNSQPEIIQALKDIGCDVVNISSHGDGVNDLFAILPDGRVILIECKTPGNVDFTPAEVRYILRLVAPSYRVFMSKEQVTQAVYQMLGLS